jgi:hypothetical protein
MNEQARRSTPAESSSFTYGPTIRLGLLPTPLRADAVTFGFGAVAYSGTDFHRADVAPSQAHSFRLKPESRLGGGVGDRFDISFYLCEGGGDGYRLPPV